MMAYTNPQQRKKGESERVRGEGDETRQESNCQLGRRLIFGQTGRKSHGFLDSLSHRQSK